jgi:dTDP-4-dehydrorhamnose reductase
MIKVKILVTGAEGQVGRELQALAPEFPAFAFTFAGSKQLDITDARAVNRFFDENRWDWLLNCAAYTAVDKAEQEPQLARLVNAEGPLLLAHACRAQGCRMVHLSTDYVYHTQQNRPFRESDPTHPRSVYARTKLAGDDAVQAEYPDGAMVLRTSWVYSAFGHNFVKTMLRLGRERAELKVVSDQIGTPTYARDLAQALLDMISAAASGHISSDKLRGIYHYSNEGAASWYDFALAIFEISGIACRVSPIPTAAYPTPAQRPPYSVLDKTNWKAVFGLPLRHWREALRDCLDRLNAVDANAGSSPQ